MKEDLVSIIMPAYNNGYSIDVALDSVLSQSYPQWELLITDDASTDNTREIVHRYCEKDERIKYFSLQNNSGAALARNHSLAQASGRYIAFLDADDRWHPHKLERQLSFIQEKECHFSFTAYQWMNADGTEIGKIVNVPDRIDYKGYLKNTIIGCLTVMLDRKNITNIEFPNIRTRQDMALWLKILKNNCSAYGLNENLAFYRDAPNSISSNKWKAAKTVWRVYREIEKLPLLISIYNFISYVSHALLKRM